MRRFIDYLILSFCIAMMFSGGYVFTAATMVILYSIVYVMLIDKNDSYNNM